MKNNMVFGYFRRKLFVPTIIFTLINCSDHEELGLDHLSEQARTFLAMRLNRGAQFEAASADVINRSFGSVMGQYFSGGRVLDDPGTGGPDSTIINDPWDWETCAVVTETENEDGSFTTVRDYGDGCEEGWEGFKYWMFGKIIETYRYLISISGTKYHTNYLYDVIYDGYGGRYTDNFTWLLNGNARYEGWAAWDTISYQFSGAFSEVSDVQSQYENINYGYSSESTVTYDANRWEQAEGGFYQFTQGDGFYRSDILKALVMRFDCQNEGIAEPLYFAMTYVSGIEKITYRQDGKSGEFMIDYGNGKCDNIIYIIENGRRIRVKLDDLWTILSGG